jgi:hypothetical protein
VQKRNIIIIIVSILLFSLICSNVASAIQSYKSRRLCNQLRERIIDAENTNKQLGRTIEQCQSICGELEQSIDRNISSARDAVEIIEEIRVQVQSLESITGGWDSDSYYNWLDSYLDLE